MREFELPLHVVSTQEELDLLYRGSAMRKIWFRACEAVMYEADLPNWRHYCRLQYDRMTPSEKQRVDTLANLYAKERGFERYDDQLVKDYRQLVDRWHRELRHKGNCR